MITNPLGGAVKSTRNRTVFLDRDGVINRLRDDYVKCWDEFELLPGAIDSIVRLASNGRQVIVVTNQSAISQNLVSAEAVDEIHRKVAGLVADRGGRIRAFLVCPHGRDDGCGCRKPSPGLLLRARDELGVELSQAVMVGDHASDVQAARAAGCAAILIDPGGSEPGLLEANDLAVVANLADAVDVICGS